MRFGITAERVEGFPAERGLAHIQVVTCHYFFTGVNLDRAATPILYLAHADVRQ